MTKEDKIKAAEELEKVRSQYCGVQGLSEWITLLRKTVWKYLPNNNIPDEVENLFYCKTLRKGGMDLKQREDSAKDMVGQLINQLKNTKDVVDSDI